MRFTKCFIVLCLCLFIEACYIPTIDIGDYANQLKEWDRQNLLDYKLRLSYYHGSNLKNAVVIVRNGIPESSDPPEWLAGGEKSTVPEFFSFVKEEKNKNTNDLSLHVSYDTVFHCPRYIERGDRSSHSTGPVWGWSIELILMPEKQQEAWDSLNILNYKLHLDYYDPSINRTLKKAVVTVKDGIPESSDPPEWLASGEKSTVPDFFSFVKEEETRLEDFILTPRDYVDVSYDSVYYYPTYISTDFVWYIELILPEETE